MNEISNWTAVSMASIKAMGIKVMGAIPNIIGAVLLLIIGWLVAKIIQWIVLKALKASNINIWTDKVKNNEALQDSNLNIDLQKVLGKFVYWVIILIFTITATDTLGWDVVSTEIGGLVRYLPKLLSAVVIFIIGILIANFIKKAVQASIISFGLEGGKIISSIVFYIIVVFLSVTALNQAGINTTIITQNITLILASVLLAFSLAFGIGSRDIFQNMLSSMYSKKTFKIGDKVRIDGVEGVIESIDSMNISLTTATGKLVMPSKYFVQQKVEILNV